MNRLQVVESNGAKYWVSAPSVKRAIELIAELDEGIADAIEDGEEIRGKTISDPGDDEWDSRYQGPNGEECSMRLAFDLVRNQERVIACSEWLQ